MRIIYMGSAPFSLPALQVLCQHHEIVGVYTRPPKSAGRGMKMQLTPVHAFAEEHNIPVHMPKTLRHEVDLDVDVIVVAAYGLIVPTSVLTQPKHGCINIHGSYLPRWRGAAPIQRALLAGDTETGITIIQMDEGIDTGDILMQEKVPIYPEDTMETLSHTLAEFGASLIQKTLSQLDQIIPLKQSEEGACYAHKITKEDQYATTVQESLNKIRVFGHVVFRDIDWIVHEAEGHIQPWPYQEPYVCMSGKGQLDIRVQDGFLRVKRIQRPSRKIMSVEEFLRGCPHPI